MDEVWGRVTVTQKAVFTFSTGECDKLYERSAPSGRSLSRFLQHEETRSFSTEP